MIDRKKRLRALSASLLGALALGLATLGCSVEYVTFVVDASGCAFGKVYEVVYEFKDNPTNDPANAPVIVRGGQRRTVSMMPSSTWTRERVEVKVYELPASTTGTTLAPTPGAPAPQRRLVRDEVLTADINLPSPVLLVCSSSP